MATQQEVVDASLEYFEGDELAAGVFATKYSLPTLDGNLLELTPDDMHVRLAKEFARIESKYDDGMSYDEVYQLLSNWEVIPQGSPLSGIGNTNQVQSLSNCFVVSPPQDSYGGILFTDQEQVQIMKRRGGVGFDISNIRPRGLPTSNAARTTDGIGIFMDRFSNSCREVAQGGRRGALMLTVDCRHPEIMTFIDIKRDRKRVTGANISIKFTDEFMRAVESDSEFTLRWPVNSTPEDAEHTSVVNAKEVWDKFVEAAHDCAEPGALFWDRVREGSPADCYADVGYETISTNPCAEIPLSPYDSCRLMVVNLSKFVKDPYKESSAFDFKRFSESTMKAQRLMDDLVDLETEAVDRILQKVTGDNEGEDVKKIETDLWNKIKQATLGGRRTGLGITALGDTLAALGIQYGSAESITMTEKIYKTLAVSAYTSSVQLAKQRGSFPVYDKSKEEGHKFLAQVWESLSPETQADWNEYGRRNIAILTTAPVGSISCLTQTTSGIEPAFMLHYKRRKKIVESASGERVDFIDDLGDRWQEFDVYHHGFKQWMDAALTEEHANLEADELIKMSPYYGATANEIDWIKSVEIQAVAQKWVCHGISKTCNLPNDVSTDMVSDVYMEAWRQGCKGFTVYRDGSRSGVLVSTDETPKSEGFVTHNAPKRPDDLPCDIHHVTIKGEQWTILVGLMDGKPYELMGGLSKFVEIPKKCKSGVVVKRARKTRASIYDLILPMNDENIKIKDIVSAFDNPNHSSFTRVLSLSLRHGAPIHYMVEQLEKGDRDMDLFSFSKVIGRVLKKYIEDGTVPGGSKDCPECNAPDSLVYTEGCVICSSCGHGKC